MKERLAQVRSAPKTNALAKTATNVASSAGLTNAAKPVAKAAPPTPAATNVVEQKLKPTNAVALSITNQPATNSTVAVAATKPPAGPTLPETSVASRSSGLGVEWTVQRTFYVAGMTGASCFLVGLFLLYRKFRRPTQSIISRSLLQR